MKTVRYYSNERPALVDLIYSASDTPRQSQSDIVSLLVKGGNPRVLSGFETTISGTTLTVSQGSAVLNYNAGSYIINGLVVGTSTPDQTYDLSQLASGQYSVFVTFYPQPTDQDTRVSYSANSTGFDSQQTVYTRESASWQLLVARQAPGIAWSSIASISLPDGTVTDQRDLLFEGNAADNFALSWGTAQDRADARGIKPIDNLETMIEALKVAIEDIKGTHWWVATGAQGGSSGGGGQTYQAVQQGSGPPPSSPSPQAGQMWIDQDTGNAYVAS